MHATAGSPDGAAGERPPGRGTAVVLAAALLAWLAVSAPLLLGTRTLYLRDVLSNHAPQKAFGAEALRRGQIPVFNPQLGLGAPYRGNPAALPFYPGNLLYLALPFGVAFNAHYVLHWLGGAISMAWLARRLGAGGEARWLAALTFAGSGYVLSCLSFYNLIAVLAWLPAMLAAATLERAPRALAWGGLCGGMALLAGEPVTLAIALAPLVAVAMARHGARRGAALALGIAALALAVAAPQVVATVRLLPYSWRATHEPLGGVAQYGFPPARWLELLLPFPFGRPDQYGARAWWAHRVAPQMPFFFTVHAGVVGLWLAGRGALRRGMGRLGAGFALAGLALASLAGPLGALGPAVGGGLFRFPEKFLVLFALGLPLAAAAGLDRARDAGGRRPWAAWSAVAALAALAALCLAARAALAAGGFPAGGAGDAIHREAPLAEILDAQAGVWAGGFLLGAATLAGSVWALERRRLAPALALQCLALAPLGVLVATDDSAPYREAPALAALLERERPAERIAAGAPWTVAAASSFTPRDGPTPYRPPAGSRASLRRLQATAFDAMPGVFWGARFPLHPDSEGLGSSLHTLWREHLERWPWPRRLAALRAAGVEQVVAVAPLASLGNGFEGLGEETRSGAVLSWARVEGVLPPAFWPDAVEVAASPRAALGRMAGLVDPAGVAVLAEAPAIAHRPGGRVVLAREEPDRIELRLAESPGGVVVVQRAFHPLYRAEAMGRRLRTQPVDAVLLGVEVPSGVSRVTIDVDGTPEAVAAGLAAVAAVALLGWGVALRAEPGVRRLGGEGR